MKKFYKQLKGNQKGFSLVELLVVVAIIGILSALALPKYTEYKLNAAKEVGVASLEAAAHAYKLKAASGAALPTSIATLELETSPKITLGGAWPAGSAATADSLCTGYDAGATVATIPSITAPNAKGTAVASTAACN